MILYRIDIFSTTALFWNGRHRRKQTIGPNENYTLIDVIKKMERGLSGGGGTLLGYGWILENPGLCYFAVD